MSQSSAHASAQPAVIRPCTPADLETAIKLIYSSGSNIFNYVFDTRQSGQSQALLRTAFADTQGEFSHRQHWGIEVCGQLAGIISIRDGQQPLAFMLNALKHILQHYSITEIPGVIWRGLKSEGVLQPPSDPKAPLICHVAVDPQFRGRGLAQQLVAHALEQIRQQGGSQAQLNVADDNHNARALYEYLGFKHTHTRNSGLKSDFGHVENQMRMVLSFS